MKLSEILRDSNYKLTQFSETQIQNLENQVIEKESKGKITYKVVCLVRKKEVVLTPEEVVRQLYLMVLTEQYQYPVKLLGLEYPIASGRETKRADIVVFEKDRTNIPYIIVEVKQPKEKDKDSNGQLKSYCQNSGALMGIWTNGEYAEYYHSFYYMTNFFKIRLKFFLLGFSRQFAIYSKPYLKTDLALCPCFFMTIFAIFLSK